MFEPVVYVDWNMVAYPRLVAPPIGAREIDGVSGAFATELLVDVAGSHVSL